MLLNMPYYLYVIHWMCSSVFAGMRVEDSSSATRLTASQLTPKVEVPRMHPTPRQTPRHHQRSSVKQSVDLLIRTCTIIFFDCVTHWITNYSLFALPCCGDKDITIMMKSFSKVMSDVLRTLTINLLNCASNHLY